MLIHLQEIVFINELNWLFSRSPVDEDPFGSKPGCLKGAFSPDLMLML
jgi:hypothetical protein